MEEGISFLSTTPKEKGVRVFHEIVSCSLQECACASRRSYRKEKRRTTVYIAEDNTKDRIVLLKSASRCVTLSQLKSLSLGVAR